MTSKNNNRSPVNDEMTAGRPYYLGPNIDSNYSPMAISIVKRVIRFADLTTLAPGTEITLGGASEVAIYSDYPVEISLGDPLALYSYIKEFRQTGRINRIFIRAYSAAVTGRVVIFTGSPSLGPNFQRENPLLYPTRRWHEAAVNWAGNATVLAILNWALPDTFAREAHYYSHFNFVRSAGTINRMYAIDQEIGAQPRVFDYAWDIPDSNVSVYLPRLHKVSTSVILYLEGSNEPVATTVETDGGFVEL